MKVTGVRAWTSSLTEKIETGLAGYSNIFFMSNSILGAVILFLSFRNFSVGIHGLAAEIISLIYWSWKARKSSAEDKMASPFNAILCGAFLGYWMQPGIKSLIFLLAVWYTNLVIHSVLDFILAKKGLPVLSLPFSLTCLLLGPLIQGQAGKLEQTSTPAFWSSLDSWSSGSGFLDQVFQSLGSVIFLPYNAIGAILLFTILLYSRWLFFGVLSALGLSWGIHSMIYPVGLNGMMPPGYWNWSHFNFALIGASLGGVFFIPSLASLSILFASFWGCLVSYYGLLYLFQFKVEAIHSFPLCIGMMVGIYLAQKMKPQALNHSMIRPLEKALDLLHLKKKRFGEIQCILDLPLRETSKILQGFDGPWTHQGKWKHALDFICVDGSGKSYLGSGEKTRDYFIYGKPVLAPIAGWVVRMEDQWDDSAIGKISFRGNWGNWILLKSPFGFFVLLAHLKKHSFLVKEGAYVELGQPLAEVGNSGYSPEPHLHLQVQGGPDVNSETLPFLLRCYSEAEGGIQFYSTPRMGSAVFPIRSNQTLQWALNFKADQELCFERNGKTFTLRSGLDPKSGYWYFEELGVRGRAYFWKDDREFYFFDWKHVSPDSKLNLFSLGLARLPFALGNQLHWMDSLLTTRLPSSLISSLERRLTEVLPWQATRRFSKIEFQSTADGTEICGTIQALGKNILRTQVELDPWVGIRAITWGDEKWMRKKAE